MPDDQVNRSLAEADRALRVGDHDRAISLYRSALAQHPGIGDAWLNCAWALRSMRRFEEAVDALNQSLRHGVSNRQAAIVNKATILAEYLNDPTTAIKELEALGRGDDVSVEALLNLGLLHEDSGQNDAAREVYEYVVRRFPGNGRARARLASLAIAANAIDDVESDLRGALATPGGFFGPSRRSSLRARRSPRCAGTLRGGI
ncbi:tetratricopeptide repeat protein [Sphingomonas sp. MMS24-JH45]